jgi:endonuclease/exonuclease/phosphatase family metal-dependent hydrolase
VQRTLIASACLALVALLGPTGAAGARTVEPVSSAATNATLRAPDTSTMDIWDFNITGAGIVEGARRVDNRGRPGAVDPVINRMKDGQRPDVIALQEVCFEQFKRLKRYLTSVDYSVEWRVNKQQPRCRDNYRRADAKRGAEHGTLVAVPDAYAPLRPVSFNLSPETPGTAEGLTCYEFTKQRAMIACSAQISGNGDEKKLKTYRMYTQMITPYLNANFGVLLAGDFNTQPKNSAMNRMYHPNLGGTGLLFEGDMKAVCASPCRDGRWTHRNRKDGLQRKIDYVFFSNNAFDQTRVSSVMVDVASSYHRFYKFSVPMR